METITKEENMKKRTKTSKIKINANVMAKNMKKQLGEFNAKRVARGLASSIKNITGNDVNMKDIFTMDELKRNQLFWVHVSNILKGN